MRTGLSTIQQTLTPESVGVLNNSIAEAGRRNHGQTTPLHVAATLLACPTGYLRKACVKSHRNSSHPLQSRALELCFSVALERLPTTQSTSPGTEPPISNALMAALKRAQAHQRKGCPEKLQQPLLAVKVELEQLIISILDDPSVSRVMREASFSSPAVKATIEQSLISSSSGRNVSDGALGIGFMPNLSPAEVPSRNLYLNPRLQQVGSAEPPGDQRNEEVKRVVEILLRSKKRNPILVGEPEPVAVVKELLKRVEKGELGDETFKNVRVMQFGKELLLDKKLIVVKIKELGRIIESCNGGGGIIVDLGNLKYLVEQPVSLGGSGSGGGIQQQQPLVSEVGRAVVGGLGKILERIGEGSNGRIWLIGTATCETYLRCQVYHPTMENDWDLQAVPIASRSPPHGMFPRVGTNGIKSLSIESLNSLKTFQTHVPALPQRVSENFDSAPRVKCCPQCSQNYEQELAELLAEEVVKLSSEVDSEATKLTLPQWLQKAKLQSSDSRTADASKKSQELQMKWRDKCLSLHPNFHHNLGCDRTGPKALQTTGLCSPYMPLRQPVQPKLQLTRNLGETQQLNSNQGAHQPLDYAPSLPGSPVRTDLALGQTKVKEAAPDKTNDERIFDFLGCISSQPQAKGSMESIKFAKALDDDSFKKLLKGLMEKAWWQREAASAVAATVTQSKSGNGKRRGDGSRGDIWLLFTGPDRVGMKKMASVLSDHMSGASPTMISLGSQCESGELGINVRGKTALDRIVEAAKRNPFSVVMLEGIGEADILVRGKIKQAMERGRLADSYGREISLGNIIFILTVTCSTITLNNCGQGHLLDEKELASSASGNWQLRLTIGGKSAKRRANWLNAVVDRSTRPRRETSLNLLLDLNEVADAEDDKTDGSNNSSDLTVDYEDDFGLENQQFAMASVPHELANSVDGTVVFKAVDFSSIRGEIKNTIVNGFSSVVDDKLSIEVEDGILERILGGVWYGQTSLTQWAEKVLVPSFQQLKARLHSNILTSSDESTSVRLESDTIFDCRSPGEWLPSKIKVMD